MKKRKSKVKLPTDKNGTPINVGDWLMFSDGPFHVNALVYIGKGPNDGWYAEGDDENAFSDNLGAGVLITYKGVSEI